MSKNLQIILSRIELGVIGNERSRNEVSQQTFHNDKTIITESTRPCLDVDRCEVADHQATYTLPTSSLMYRCLARWYLMPEGFH